MACTIDLAGWIGDLMAGGGDGGEVRILSELGFVGLLGVVGRNILSELGFMGLLGVVGRNIFSFEWIEVVIFLTMYKISTS